MKFLALIVACVLLSPVSFAETTDSPSIGTRYIRDYVMVPVRSGQSEAHRIVHRGIRSGTRIELLETNAESGYSRIRLNGGIEGWVGSQYLQEEPTAELRLQEANRTISRLTSSTGSVGAKLLETENENNSLKKELSETQKALSQTRNELEQLQAISANAVAMNDENKRLLKENETLKNRHDTLKADNHRLEEALQHDEFMNGAIAVLLGIIATLVIQYFQRTRKRTEWA